jgi:hypothetical protein
LTGWKPLAASTQAGGSPRDPFELSNLPHGGKWHRLKEFCVRAKDAKKTEWKKSFPFATFALFARNRPLTHGDTSRKNLAVFVAGEFV